MSASFVRTLRRHSSVLSCVALVLFLLPVALYAQSPWERAALNLARYEQHTIEVIVDRLVRREGIRQRLERMAPYLPGLDRASDVSPLPGSD